MIFRVSECLLKHRKFITQYLLRKDNDIQSSVQVQTTITYMAPNSKTASKCLNMLFKMSIFQYTVFYVRRKTTFLEHLLKFFEIMPILFYFCQLKMCRKL